MCLLGFGGGGGETEVTPAVQMMSILKEIRGGAGFISVLPEAQNSHLQECEITRITCTDAYTAGALETSTG